MTNREELYRKFGPLLAETICLIVKDEINLLRTKLGLPERTEQQILDAVKKKLDSLSEYEWMKKSNSV